MVIVIDTDKIWASIADKISAAKGKVSSAKDKVIDVADATFCRLPDFREVSPKSVALLAGIGCAVTFVGASALHNIAPSISSNNDDSKEPVIYEDDSGWANKGSDNSNAYLESEDVLVFPNGPASSRGYVASDSDDYYGSGADYSSLPGYYSGGETMHSIYEQVPNYGGSGSQDSGSSYVPDTPDEDTSSEADTSSEEQGDGVGDTESDTEIGTGETADAGSESDEIIVPLNPPATTEN